MKLREILTAHKELARKLSELEHKVASHDEHIQSLFEAIRRLMTTPDTKRRRIGFEVRERVTLYRLSKVAQNR